MWKLEIERANNGYILKGQFGDNLEVTSIIINEPNTEFGELEAMRDLLLEIKEYFGVYRKKYAKRNVIVDIEKMEV